ncbi:MAG TPA: DHHA1 domain-containing protein, partial [Candidatus Paceibacterota bacterium]|nr:DHHA1 domain-containing protein [Candidatus Paceibacterota bacterium]
KHLEDKNQERRESVETILQAIESRFGDKETPALIVLGAENWSLGVLGLTAARVVEKYGCPVFLWGKNGAGEIKGSCRSDGTVNMVELMAAAGGTDFFSNFGGHVMAGGFSLSAEREADLLPRLERAMASLPRLEAAVGHTVDAVLSLDEVTESMWQTVNRLAPFGIGNPKPVFLFNNVELASARGFGNGGIHLELSFKAKWGTVKAIGFFLCTPNERGEFDASYGHRFKGVILEKGRRINLLANIEKSYFRGRPELRLRIVDIQ